MEDSKVALAQFWSWSSPCAPFKLRKKFPLKARTVGSPYPWVRNPQIWPSVDSEPASGGPTEVRRAKVQRSTPQMAPEKNFQFAKKLEVPLSPLGGFLRSKEVAHDLTVPQNTSRCNQRSSVNPPADLSISRFGTCGGSRNLSSWILKSNLYKVSFYCPSCVLWKTTRARYTFCTVVWHLVPLDSVRLCIKLLRIVGLCCRQNN